MAGFFGFFDYNKPGKGVDKDAPEKRPFFLFFELAGRKFGRLILFNLIYFIILLPILTVLYFLLYGLLFSWFSQSGGIGSPAGTGAGLTGLSLPLLPGVLFSVAQTLPLWLDAALLLLSVVLYGPASCGLAFMLCNFARQRHVWNSDFFVQLRRNFKRGLALGLLDILLFGLFVYNLGYPSDGAPPVLMIAKYGSGMLLTVYLLMRNYIFVLAVIDRQKITRILKNAFFLAGLGLWRNLLTLVVNAALFVLVLFAWQFIELALVPLLLFSVTGFVAVFTCFPVIKKYLLDPKAGVTPEV